jgi:hypothetical protein
MDQASEEVLDCAACNKNDVLVVLRDRRSEELRTKVARTDTGYRLLDLDDRNVSCGDILVARHADVGFKSRHQ